GGVSQRREGWSGLGKRLLWSILRGIANIATVKFRGPSGGLPQNGVPRPEHSMAQMAGSRTVPRDGSGRLRALELGLAQTVAAVVACLQSRRTIRSELGASPCPTPYSMIPRVGASVLKRHGALRNS